MKRGERWGPALENRIKLCCPQGHPYTPANTYRDSRGTRYCRRCKRASAHRAVQGFVQLKGPRPKAPKVFQPSEFFGNCPKCGKLRTCVHRCPLDDEIQRLVRREALRLDPTA